MIDFRRYSLSNGLRIIHSYDPSSVLLTINVLYDTGARDERRGLTGIAHLFEHLMFGGSINIPDFDLELHGAGGSSNAWTSNDFTNFYDTLPAVNVETAFHLESDRMMGLSFSRESLEVQRSVVIEEFKQQCLNRPYGDLFHGLRGALYNRNHPYSWPVIGIEPSHIAAVTEKDTRQWFYSHYAPNNAVLSITGNLPYDRGRELVEKWFGDIPYRDIVKRELPDPGFPKEDLTVRMSGNVPNSAVVVAIPMDRYGTYDYRVADCITDILSSGRSSRFLQNLILNGNGQFIEADASIVGSEEPGFLMLNARTDGDVEQAANLMLNQLELLSIPGNLTSHELERTFNCFESNYLINNLSPVMLAQNLALSEMHNENIKETIAKQKEIKLSDISRVASKLLSTPKVKLVYSPGK